MRFSRQPLIRPRIHRPVGLSALALPLLALLLLLAIVPASRAAIGWVRSGSRRPPHAIAVRPIVNPRGGPTSFARTVDPGVVPAKLDLVMLQDVTTSFEKTLPVVAKLLPSLLQQLSAKSDLSVGVATFADHAGVSPSGEDPYQLLAAPSADRSRVVEAYQHMSVGEGGGDPPEASLEALGKLLVDPAVRFRPGARPVVVLATDAAPHVPGDATYLGQPLATIKAELKRMGVVLIELTPTTELLTSGLFHDLALATGGSVQAVDGGGTDLAAALQRGLKAVPKRTPLRSSCPDASVQFTPPVVTRPGTRVGITITPDRAARGLRSCRLELGDAVETVVVRTGPVDSSLSGR